MIVVADSALTTLYAHTLARPGHALSDLFQHLLLFKPELAMTLVHHDPVAFPATTVGQWVTQKLPAVEGSQLIAALTSRNPYEAPHPTAQQGVQDTWLVALHRAQALPALLTWTDADDHARHWTGPVHLWAVAKGRTGLVNHLLNVLPPAAWSATATSSDPEWPAAHAATLALRLRRWDLLDTLAERVGPFPRNTVAEQAWVHVNARHGKNLDGVVALLQRLGQLPTQEQELTEGLRWQARVAPQKERQDTHWLTDWSARLGHEALAHLTSQDLTVVEGQAIQALLKQQGVRPLAAEPLKEVMRLACELPLVRVVKPLPVTASGDQAGVQSAQWSLLGAYTLAYLARVLRQKGGSLSSAEKEPLLRAGAVTSDAPAAWDQVIEQGTVGGRPATLTLRGLYHTLGALKTPGFDGWAPTTDQEVASVIGAVCLAHRRWQVSPLLNRARDLLFPMDLTQSPLKAADPDTLLGHRLTLAALGSVTETPAEVARWTQWMNQQPPTPALARQCQSLLDKTVKPMVSPTLQGLPMVWGWKPNPFGALEWMQALINQGAQLVPEHKATLRTVLAAAIADENRLTAQFRVWEAAPPEARRRPRLRS